MSDSPVTSDEQRLQEVYVAQLRSDCVQLIRNGHALMDGHVGMAADEDAITGELVRSIRVAMAAPDAPSWMDRYHVQEQTRQNAPGKLGKSRPVLDVWIERSGLGPRPHCGFEAKRLGPGQHSVGEYLGENGLSAFLQGYYATPHGIAGMLGYVQRGTTEEWCERLRSRLNQRPERFRVVVSSSEWESSTDVGLGRSLHRSAAQRQLDIVHILLGFSARSRR